MNKSYSRIKLGFDRLLSKSIWQQFSILGVALIIIFFLSWFFLHCSGGKWEDFCKENELSEWLLPLYLLIDSNALNNLYINSVNGWALFVSSAIYVVGMFIFNGMIISIITNAIEQRVNDHKKGHIHYLKAGHHIIMGYDEMVPSIITHIFKKDKDAFVLLLTSADVINIHEDLQKSFNRKQLKQVIINYGHRTSTESFQDIHLEAAEEIYVVGNRMRPAHDAINVECVDSICCYMEQPEIKDHPGRIICVFEDLDTYAAFKTSEIFDRVKNLNIEFIPYSFYSGWAKQVFIRGYHKDMDRPNEEIRYPSVYGNGITPEDKKYVHLVFIGTTNFAVAFAMEAAHVLHFPNFNKDHKLKTRITFIDKNADSEMAEFITRNRHFFEIQSHYYQDLSENAKSSDREIRPPLVFNQENGYDDKDHDFLDIEFEFIKGDIFSSKVQSIISRWAKEKDAQYLSIFLALSNQRENFAFGMNMPDEVYDNEIPVFIRQNRSDNFVSNLRNSDKKIKDNKKKNTYCKIDNGELREHTPLGGRYSHIYPFGMNETAYCADENSLKRAKLINYLYCTANYDNNKFQGISSLDAMPADQIWAEADRYWKGLSVALKWSSLYNAYTIRTKLATLRAMRGLNLADTSRDLSNLSDTEVEELARVEHNRWNVEKLLMGYRKPHIEEDKYAHPDYANNLKNNKGRFIHHDIRAFEDLDSIKELDYEFSRYIPWIMRMTTE